MRQNKKQKSFGNSLSVENLDYPIIIYVPHDYWSYSNFPELDVKYLKESK